MTSNFVLGLAVLGTFRSVTKDVNPSRPVRKDAIENSAEFTPTIVGKNKNGNSLVRMHVANTNILACWTVRHYRSIRVLCRGPFQSSRPTRFQPLGRPLQTLTARPEETL
jgi:hypothetical protein